MKYYSNGKLLITGEYLVLDGAKSLAIPTKQGQSLDVKYQKGNIGVLQWKSFDLENNIWFECDININSFKIITTSDKNIATVLLAIFKEINILKPAFFKLDKGLVIHTNLDFERNWGLGTSSTLINNIATWANINAFDLQFKIFGGSAYDIACAQNNTPILYQLNNKKPIIEKVNFKPEFIDNLFFIHLNNKQNSRDAISLYQNKNIDKKELISEINDITDKIIKNKSLKEFEYLIKNHENIISEVLNIAPIKKRLFHDYLGEIKSLGAWGGDFILATGSSNSISYFKKKGYQTVIPFSKMIL